ncbi:MAG: CRISPR-associated endonuclease Cas3'', partial [Clostridium sp. SCN 57-10]
MVYLAHVHADEQTGQREQSMAEHLTNTAKQAAAFAEAFSAGEAGYLCGILHDIGKYSAAFQRRIRGSGEQTDHATAGAQTAFSQFRNLPAAFCIAGHHGGLPDGGSSRAGEGGTATLAGRMKKQVDDCGAYRTEISVPAADLPRALVADARSAFFFTRMLYSCLVDADYLDTEAFMSNGAVRRGEADPLSELSARLDRYVASWKNAESDLNRMRGTILRALTDAGASAPGLFSLTVPTGGGKTVSSVAFALRHALAHGLRHVIYGIPYTSIIE